MYFKAPQSPFISLNKMCSVVVLFFDISTKCKQPFNINETTFVSFNCSQFQYVIFCQTRIVKQYGRYMLKNEDNNVSKYFITFVMSISSQFNLFHINLQRILIIQYSEVKYYLFSITLGICFATVFNHCY